VTDLLASLRALREQLRTFSREIGGVASLIRRKHQLSTEELQQTVRLDTWEKNIFGFINMLDQLLTHEQVRQDQDQQTGDQTAARGAAMGEGHDSPTAMAEQAGSGELCGHSWHFGGKCNET
jgi:hypothetical protein